MHSAISVDMCVTIREANRLEYIISGQYAEFSYGSLQKGFHFSADRLAEVLTAVAMPVAEAQPRVPVTAPSQERIVTIKTLAALGRRLPIFCQRAYLGEAGAEEWADLSDILLSATHACREQVVIDIDADC